MKVKQTLEFELEVEVVRNDKGDASIVVVKVDSDGGEFFYPKDFDWERDTDLGDGRVGTTIDTVPAETIEGVSDEEIVEAYFNSEYGVA